MIQQSIWRIIQWPLIGVVLLLGIYLAEQSLGLNLTPFGVRPRTAEGLLGLLFSPLIHGSVTHLFSNISTLLLLGVGLQYFYPTVLRKAMPYLYFLPSLGVWFFGRAVANGGIPVYHIGASGVLYAFAALLFFSGVFRKNRASLSISLGVGMLYHGMLYSLFPTEEGVSWEAHLSGFLVGALVAFAYRNTVSSFHVDQNAEEEEIEGEVGYQELENKTFKYHYRSDSE